MQVFKPNRARQAVLNSLLPLLILTVTGKAYGATVAPTCSALFGLPSESYHAPALLIELAKLRLEIDKQTDRALARLLYTEFTERMRDVRAMGLDTSKFEALVAAVGEGRAVEVQVEERRVERAKEQIHSLHAPLHQEATLHLDSYLLFSSALLPDASGVVYTPGMSTIAVRDRAANVDRLKFNAGVEFVQDLSVSSDGALLKVSGQAGKEPTMAVFDLHKGTPLYSQKAGRAAFSRDGSQIAVATKKKILILDARTGKTRHEITTDWKMKSISSIDFSPDGTKLVAVRSEESAKIWDINSGTELVEMDAPKASAARFSPDGTIVAVGARQDGEIFLYRTGDRQSFEKLTQPIAGLRSLEFSPDGQFLYSANHARGLHVWRLFDYRLTATVPSYSPVSDLSLSRDGLAFSFSGNGANGKADVHLYGMPKRND